MNVLTQSEKGMAEVWGRGLDTSLEGCVSVQLRAPRDSRAYEGAGVNQQMLSGLAAECGRVSRPDPGGVRCLVLLLGPREVSLCSSVCVCACVRWVCGSVSWMIGPLSLRHPPEGGHGAGMMMMMMIKRAYQRDLRHVKLYTMSCSYIDV